VIGDVGTGPEKRSSGTEVHSPAGRLPQDLRWTLWEPFAIRSALVDAELRAAALPFVRFDGLVADQIIHAAQALYRFNVLRNHGLLFFVGATVAIHHAVRILDVGLVFVSVLAEFLQQFGQPGHSILPFFDRARDCAPSRILSVDVISLAADLVI
jgi:hypothetical protein